MHIELNRLVSLSRGIIHCHKVKKSITAQNEKISWILKTH